MSCDCFPLRWQQAIAPGGSDQYAVDFTGRLARTLSRRTSYDLGTFLRSARVAGFEWEVTQAGQTGVQEPRLPAVVGRTVKDGGCELTCRPLSTASLEAQLSAAAWSAPAGITISNSQVDAAQKATATISVAANTVPGEYTIKVTATAGSKVIVQDCILKVGNC